MSREEKEQQMFELLDGGDARALSRWLELHPEFRQDAKLESQILHALRAPAPTREESDWDAMAAKIAASIQRGEHRDLEPMAWEDELGEPGERDIGLAAGSLSVAPEDAKPTLRLVGGEEASKAPRRYLAVGFGTLSLAAVAALAFFGTERNQSGVSPAAFEPVPNAPVDQAARAAGLTYEGAEEVEQQAAEAVPASPASVPSRRAQRGAAPAASPTSVRQLDDFAGAARAPSPSGSNGAEPSVDPEDAELRRVYAECVGRPNPVGISVHRADSRSRLTISGATEVEAECIRQRLGELSRRPHEAVRSRRSAPRDTVGAADPLAPLE